MRWGCGRVPAAGRSTALRSQGPNGSPLTGCARPYVRLGAFPRKTSDRVIPGVRPFPTLHPLGPVSRFIALSGGRGRVTGFGGSVGSRGRPTRAPGRPTPPVPSPPLPLESPRRRGPSASRAGEAGGGAQSERDPAPLAARRDPVGSTSRGAGRGSGRGAGGAAPRDGRRGARGPGGTPPARALAAGLSSSPAASTRDPHPRAETGGAGGRPGEGRGAPARRYLPRPPPP